MNTKVLRIAGVLTLLFRLGFATILFYAAKESDTEFLKWTLLVIMSAMSVYALYRTVKIFGHARRVDLMEDFFTKKN